MSMVEMIRDSAGAVAPRGGDLSRVRALRFTRPGFDAALWRQMAEMGWVGLRVSEELGGTGLGMAEYCALAEELGRGLAPEPLVPGVLSAALLAGCGDTAGLEALLAGEALPLTAWQERADTLEAPGTPGAARVFVPMAAGATGFLLPVREDGGFALHAAEAVPEILETQDGGHYGRITAGGTRIDALPVEALDQALDEAALATAAMLLGVMERSFAMTLDYLRTRQQFGKPIGSFQALQHRAVDLQIQVTLTRASVEAAAATLDAGATPAARRAAVSRAKVRAAEAALLVTRAAVQLHGAIGYTDEYDVGLYLRKAMVLANQFGSAALHRRRFLANAVDADE
ncbi:acyl-CoA dehydrogenase family protein [Falsiroseomonas tokyonensis]|uniref:Acyl-CoA dehydrogenase family protein n=1 Tax=Falsiroseomonas tokyonensis TaxID=430521 RepID=A0ABV7BYR7_9PROT|nr:acyl-CoA dehydrogenase family protein [Falsiroseomonas tokyonensis]MBU8539777.1 acyl-CoA dehydrogenase family protein [Falsiroseomonas tokyonensis]